MVSFSKIVVFTSSAVLLGYFTNRMLDAYSDYVSEEGWKYEDIFGGSGSSSAGNSQAMTTRSNQRGNAGRGNAGRGNSNLSNKQRTNEEAKLYQTMVYDIESSIQDNDFQSALDKCEKAYEVVQSSPGLKKLDNHNILYKLLRLAGMSKDYKVLAKYAPVAIEGFGPAPVPARFDEVIYLVEIIVKDLVEQEKYQESIDTIKFYMKKYNNYRAAHIASYYSMLIPIYQKMGKKQEYSEAVIVAADIAKKSNDQQVYASALVDLLDYYTSEKNDEKVDETVQLLEPIFASPEERFTFNRVVTPLFFQHGYYDRYIKACREIVVGLEQRINNREHSAEDKLKLRNHLLQDKNSLAYGLLIAGQEEEAMQIFKEVMDDEDLIYTLKSHSKYYATKEAAVANDNTMTVTLINTPSNTPLPSPSESTSTSTTTKTEEEKEGQEEEQKPQEEGQEGQEEQKQQQQQQQKLVLVCEFENPQEGGEPFIIEKPAEKEVTFQQADIQDLDVTKPYLAKITLYNESDRTTPLSKHIQIISPQDPIKGKPDETTQAAYF